MPGLFRYDPQLAHRHAVHHEVRRLRQLLDVDVAESRPLQLLDDVTRGRHMLNGGGGTRNCDGLVIVQGVAKRIQGVDAGRRPGGVGSQMPGPG